MAQKAQADAIESEIEQQLYLIETVQKAYKNLRIEKAKFILAFLNPIFFQHALESLDGAKLAVANYWAMGDGLFFYRNFLACQVGKYPQNILFSDELTNEQLTRIAVRLQSSVRWAEVELQGAMVK